jgi:hypothetical protein
MYRYLKANVGSTGKDGGYIPHLHMLIFWAVIMLWDSGLLSFWTLPIVRYSIEHDVSGTAYVSVLKWRNRRHLFCLARGRAITQAVSSRLPTTAARIRSKVRSCGICGVQSGTGTGFLRILRFPMPIFIPPTAPHSSSSIVRGWYNRTISGRLTKWNQSHPTQWNKKKTVWFTTQR